LRISNNIITSKWEKKILTFILILDLQRLEQ
jgi:hypothetical protein